MSTSSPRLPMVWQHMALWALCAILLVPAPARAAMYDHSYQTSRLAQSQSRSLDFSIKAQSLRSALLEFSKQSGIQLIYVARKEPSRHSPPLQGTYTIRQALTRLLDKSGFEYEFSEENTVTVRTIDKENTRATKDAPAAPTQSTTEIADNLVPDLEEIISIGTRVTGQTALQTPVPVDTFNARSMAETGETETGRILQFLAPSFNFPSSSISDGTDSIKPATLRGLGPDQILVLINGKRRHTSALIHVNTSVGRGATGVDLNAIPPGAIKRIEVLRDGASAQYGSDAIAGVINIILKDQRDKGEVSTSYGQTYDGDGDTFVANARYGFELPHQGTLSIAAEYRDQAATNRAGLTGCLQFETGGQEACAEGNIAIDPRETNFNRKNFRIGDSQSRQKLLVVNMDIPLTDVAEFYMYGTYSDRDNLSTGFYRRANEFTRTVIELYPDGFLPRINASIQDHSLLGGVRWALDNGWSIDSSLITGGNKFQFQVENSVNASLGPNSPTSANAGTLKIHQTTVNIDVSKSFEKANIAFGAEWRNENYRIIAGAPASYIDGGQLNRNCPGCDITPLPYAPGFQLFRGFSPDNAVDESRHNLALYTDVEVRLFPHLLLNMAARYEDYSDFGSRINAKFAARYELSSRFALRGSISSGFRAPSMQQKFFNSTNTQFVEVNGVFVAQERGTFRNDSDLARALGIPELKKETAINYSLGFVATPMDNLTITADYYRIEIKDRIAVTGSIPISKTFPEITAATGATNGQFFTNMADTQTRGVDVVVHYNFPMPTGQKLGFSFAANTTSTNIRAGSIATPLAGVDDIILFSLQDRSIIEKWQPSTRANFTLEYGIGQWNIILRNNIYGTYEICEGSCDILSGEGQNIQKFGAKLLTDLQISYNFAKSHIRVTLGANNMFNVFPDVNKIGQSRAGSIEDIISSPGVFTYSRRSAPFGHNGGYYYLRATKSF